jgi:mono/diheme cytochrome c family protein
VNRLAHSARAADTEFVPAVYPTEMGMVLSRRLILIAAVSAIALVWRLAPVPADPPPKSANESFDKSLKPVLSKYCFDCHGATKQKGDLSLHDKDAASLFARPDLWEKVAKKLAANEMPPPERPQPTADERRAVVAWLNRELANSHGSPNRSRQITLRRLNRVEYNNTIRDLLALDFQPADDFPADDVGYGFDNIGGVLSLSPLLLEKYLSAAETIVQKAFTGELPPLPPKRDIRSREFRASGKTSQGPERGIVFTDGEMSVTHNFPRDGDYVFLYRALGNVIDKDAVKIAIKIDGVEKHTADLKKFKAGDTPPDREVTLKVAGGSHAISFGIVNPKSNPEDPDPKKRERSILLGSMELRGPLVPLVRTMPEAYRRIMIAQPGPDLGKAACAQKIVTNFARCAFRRPPTTDEVAKLVKLVELAESQGDSFERGIQLAVDAILVSPHFLFKVERDRKDASEPYPITDHELATRLSYFLWSSCPDDELSALADRGELSKNLESQVRRMLKDPKSRALADNFAGQWLLIRNLKAAAPDPKQFPQFDDALRFAMLQETTLFFDAMIREDRSVLDFLDADFTFLNERSAKHYGIAGVKGDQFRRVSLSGTPRAGILTHASILTVTSNVTRTSPVKRGKFIMESVLNADVPPPPPGVPELSESKDAVAGASLRQRMEVHRTNPDCAVCHQKMDPLGFAFENFDAIGAWRPKDGAFEIDPSGTLPDGRTFRDPAELRRRLREKPDEFRRSLAEKLLTYALGRGVGSADRDAIDRICEQTRAGQDKLSALLLAIVDSEPFGKRPPTVRAP